MTTFTVTTAQNIDALASKAGGDVYNINGGTLTIDQDSRYGLNQTTSTSLGALTISSTLGGVVNIDARNVRLIPYNSGSGNVPADGTTVSQGAVTGKLIGVWSAINAAPTAAGATMPASGFVKVKQVNTLGGYASGALTGIGASATGADVAGWIEIVGDEAATSTIPRLGSFNVLGEWFEVGTTTGTNTDTYQLPTSGSTQNFPGCHVETSVAGVYDFYPALGTFAGAGLIGTDESRGRVCWISTAGVLRLGHDGANSIGYCPPAGRKIRIGNVLLVNCTTAARTANATPNSSLGTRHTFTTTGGGTISISKALCSWYSAFVKANAVTISDSAINDRLYVESLGSAFSFSRSGVGFTAAQQQIALTVLGCNLGGTISNCAWARVGAGTVVGIIDSLSITMTDDRGYMTSGYISGYYGYGLTRVFNSTFTRVATGPGPITPSGCANLTFKDTISWGRLGASATRGGQLFYVLNQTYRILFDGVTLPNSDGWVSGQIVNLAGFSYEDIELRNIGSAASPSDWGGTTGLSVVFYITGASYTKRIKMRRVYIVGVSGYATVLGDSTTDGVQLDNVYVGYTGPLAYTTGSQNLRVRGMRGIPSQGGSVSLAYGTHWLDFFTSATAGKFYIEMNDPSPATASLITLTGGAAFTGAGVLYMPTIGQTATFEMDSYRIGHTGFANSAVLVYGSSGTNYTYRYQIDKNDGAGWSSWSASKTATTLGTALNSETGIDATKGVKIKLELTTAVTNASPITSLALITTCTTTTQGYQYPLELATVNVSGLATGSIVKVAKVSDGTILGVASESAGAVSFSFEYAGAVAVEARKASSSPYYKPWVSQVTAALGATVSATAVQQLDE